MEAFCIASGPSLTPEDCELVRAWREASTDRRVYVTNNTYQLCGWADTLFAGDSKWREFYGAHDFAGRRVTSKKAAGWETIPSGMPWYQNSGAAIISLAMHEGANRVYLLGYDCKKTGGKTHWHGSHVGVLSSGRVLKDATNMREWPSVFAQVATAANAAHVRIVNCTRDTALKCFKRQSLEACLAQPST